MAEIPMPASIRALPIDPVRKIPVPWFVAWQDGRPEFRAMDPEKLVLAIREKRCWVCGEKLNNRATFVIGPMCAINRVSSEPPSHHECAVYSARACPFLSRPHMERREGGGKFVPAPGCPILRNPGVTLLWTAKTPGASPFRQGSGVLFSLWPPTAVEWWCEGRAATREEVLHSVDTGLPTLRGLAEADGPDAVALLDRMVRQAEPFYPNVIGGRP